MVINYLIGWNQEEIYSWNVSLLWTEDKTKLEIKHLVPLALTFLPIYSTEFLTDHWILLYKFKIHLTKFFIFPSKTK